MNKLITGYLDSRNLEGVVDYVGPHSQKIFYPKKISVGYKY